MPGDSRSYETRDLQPEVGGGQPIRPSEPPVTLEDTQPSQAAQSPSPDDVETAELPGQLGEPTIAMDRVPTGLTPTAGLPRTVPPPQRLGYVPPHPAPARGGQGEGERTTDRANGGAP